MNYKIVPKKKVVGFSIFRESDINEAEKHGRSAEPLVEFCDSGIKDESFYLEAAKNTINLYEEFLARKKKSSV